MSTEDENPLKGEHATMTNQQILEKAIQKAIDNGWNARLLEDRKWLEYSTNKYGGKSGMTLTNRKLFGDYNIIFNKEFAKALWGEESGYIVAYEYDESIGPAWQYHLQQLVIADDPIKYLEEHLEK